MIHNLSSILQCLKPAPSELIKAFVFIMPSRSILKRPIYDNRPPRLSPLPTPHALPFARYLPDTLTPRVHFPSTPSMITSMHQTHAPHVYDRAPILVSPNVCFLPERDNGSEETMESYFDPRTFEICQNVEKNLIATEDLDRLAAPARILPSDLLSESDDSDLGSPQLSPPIYANLSTSTPAPALRSKPRVDRRMHAASTSTLSSNASTKTTRPQIRRAARSSHRVTSSHSASFEEPPLDGCLGGFWFYI